MASKFTIKTQQSGKTRTIRVFVYDTTVLMRRAVKRRRPKETYQKAGAVTLPYSRYRVEQDGEVKLPDAGEVYLARNYMSIEVLSHEAGHVAQHIYSDDLFEKFGHIEDNHDGEEAFCYLVGDIAQALYNGVKRLGMFTE